MIGYPNFLVKGFPNTLRPTSLRAAEGPPLGSKDVTPLHPGAVPARITVVHDSSARGWSARPAGEARAAPEEGVSDQTPRERTKETGAVETTSAANPEVDTCHRRTRTPTLCRPRGAPPRPTPPFLGSFLLILRSFEDLDDGQILVLLVEVPRALNSRPFFGLTRTRYGTLQTWRTPGKVTFFLMNLLIKSFTLHVCLADP